MKWSLQVPFKTDLPCGAVNVFSVYMLVHARIVFVQPLAGCAALSVQTYTSPSFRAHSQRFASVNWNSL